MHHKDDGQIPRAVQNLLDVLEQKDCEIRHGRQNISVRYQGQGIGGWNAISKHWYINSAIARGHEQMLRGYEFSPPIRNGGADRRWVLPGAENASVFQIVFMELTLVRIP